MNDGTDRLRISLSAQSLSMFSQPRQRTRIAGAKLALRGFADPLDTATQTQISTLHQRSPNDRHSSLTRDRRGTMTTLNRALVLLQLESERLTIFVAKIPCVE